MQNKNIKIWQIFYDEASRKRLEPGFIPYDNTGKLDNYFENSVILDIWKNRRDEWVKAEYVGIVSWRFFEKTRLTYEKIVQQVKGKPVYLMTPPMYMTFKSPVSTVGFGSVRNVAQIADEENILPFKYYDYNNEDCISFCNFFLVKPEIFDWYCREYLSKAVSWMKNAKKGTKLKKQLDMKCPHREGKPYPTETFFLEALFQIFVHYNKIPYSYLFDSAMYEKYVGSKEKDAHFAELLMS